MQENSMDILIMLKKLTKMIEDYKKNCQNGTIKEIEINKINEIEKMYTLSKSIADAYSNKLGDEIDYKEILDNLDVDVYVADKAGITVYVNDGYLKSTNSKKEDLINKSVYELLEEGDVFKHSTIPQIIKTKSPVTATGRDMFSDGRETNRYASGKPVLDDNGNLKFAVVSIFDTNKLKLRYDEFISKIKKEEAVRVAKKENIFINSMIGTNDAINKIRHTIDKVAGTDATVLITGESGVGKESVADRIYLLSNRVDKPYIKVNCTAIPANLLESELFGYEKGSFTGANAKGKMGLFEMADKGTIMLDEIGDLPIELQTKLLRVIQQKEIMKIGAAKPIKIDVRIISATNANLKEKIKEGKFREDLYYRLSVVPIIVPPLRERKDDIEKLTKYFISSFTKKYNKELDTTEEFINALRLYDWPGNVREMQNIIEYLVICSDGQTMDLNKFYETIGDDNLNAEIEEENNNFYENLDNYEKKLISKALTKYGGVRKAAHHLKVNPSTISRKAKKYGIELPDSSS